MKQANNAKHLPKASVRTNIFYVAQSTILRAIEITKIKKYTEILCSQ